MHARRSADRMTRLPIVLLIGSASGDDPGILRRRYVERCDCTAGLARAGIERATLDAAPDAPLALGAILDALQRSGVTPAASEAKLSEARRAFLARL